MTIDISIERGLFEVKIWEHYQRLKAVGWSHPDEGDSTDPASMFWKTPEGKYGVTQIEAAWNGWLMAAGLASY